jgi:biotin synthase-like enzyme
MTTINQLSTKSPVVSGDKLLAYSVDDGDARKVSVGTVRDFVQTNMTDATASTLTVSEYVQTTAYLVANLPAASATLAGARAHVTDSNAAFTAGIGAIVAGGGANVVPVFCDGTNWRIG